jgi:ABC-2 type transport system ATP-binding protein
MVHGKTTTIKSIVGILEVKQGDIFVDNLSVKDNLLDVKKNIAYIPDNPEVYNNLTGIQYLNFISNIYNIKDKEIISKYAKEFELYDELDNVISSYSHGMKQKLVIISALIHNPKLLILDEPFVGLDPIAQFKLKEIMREFCNRGCSVFFSSHILDVVEKICDRVAIIKNGKIEKIGSVHEVINDKSLESVFLEIEGEK